MLAGAFLVTHIREDANRLRSISTMINSLHPSAQLAVTRFQTQVPRFRDEFEQKLQSIVEGLSQRGVLRSGVLIHDVQKACQAEMRRRIFTARDCVLEGLESDWSPSESEIMEAFSHCFTPSDYRMFHQTDIQEAMGRAIASSGVIQSDQQANALHLSISQVQVDAHNESVAALKAAARKRKVDTAVKDQHNYYAPVGAVQTGQNNVAYVSQQIGGDVEALVAALVTLRDATAGNDRTVATSVLAAQALDEVQARKSISPKAKSLLEGIGATIRTIGEAIPAYHAVALAASACGLPLPPLPGS